MFVLAAAPAMADLFRVESTVGLGANYIFDDNDLAEYDGGVHGDFTIGWASMDTSIYAQTDGSADFFNIDTATWNGSFILTHVAAHSKYGGFVGGISKPGYDLMGHAGLIGMTEVGSNGHLEGEAGLLTSLQDGEIFADSTFYAASKYSHTLNNTLSAFGSAAFMGREEYSYARALVGFERIVLDGQAVANFAIGGTAYNGEFFPSARAEVKWHFNADTPAEMTPIMGRLFDKFEPLEFLYYRSGRLMRPYCADGEFAC